MQPLATTQRMATWLSMCPVDESTSRGQQFFHIAHTVATLTFNAIHVVASVAFCLKYFSIDIGGVAFAFMAIVGTSVLICTLIMGIRMREQIGEIFADLSTIYRTHEKDTVAYDHLVKANDTSEWMWSIYFKYIAFTFVSFVSNMIVSVLSCYMTEEHFNYDIVFRPIRIFLPWDQTTPAGYLAEMWVTTCTSYGYLILTGMPLLLFISLCIHHQAFYNIFKHSIDKSAQPDAKVVHESMRFYISAKNWFRDSANIYRSIIFVQLSGGAVVMTISAFLLDLQSQHFDFFLASAISTTSIGIGVLFLYCYFGQLTTDSYEKMSDCVYNMEWYQLPSTLQKYFILMIQNMQKPLYYHGYEVVRMDLRTFIRLSRSVYSYYLAIKTMTAK